MHEYGLTQNLLELALHEAAQRGAERILTLSLAVGELSGVVPEAVELYFELLSRGTPAEGARLHFRQVPATLFCPDCAWSFPKSRDYTCPRCGRLARPGREGREFYLESMEVETKGENEKERG